MYIKSKKILISLIVFNLIIFGFNFVFAASDVTNRVVINHTKSNQFEDVGNMVFGIVQLVRSYFICCGANSFRN